MALSQPSPVWLKSPSPMPHTSFLDKAQCPERCGLYLERCCPHPDVACVCEERQVSVGEGDSHLQEAAHSWGQARGCLGQGQGEHQTDFSGSPTGSPSPSGSLPTQASHHRRAGCMVQEVKIRSYSQENVCHSVLAHCGPA